MFDNKIVHAKKKLAGYLKRFQSATAALPDGIIVLGELRRIQIGGSFNFSNKDIIVIQTKAKGLGMYLMGQAFFPREIMKRYSNDESL